MAQYKHILAATEFHRESLPIVSKGVELARLYQAKLSVISVVPNVPYYMASGLSSVSDVEDQLSKETQKKLDSLKVRFPDMEIACHLVRGVPKVEILKLANQIQADLMVIGSHGRQGVQLLLGSTASSVIHRANCDILMVREKP
jgi:universal stress protein A